MAFVYHSGLIAQSDCDAKHDAIWLYGFNAPKPQPDFGGTNIDFNFDPASLYKVEREMPINSQNGSICDENGQLILYSNGCYIANEQNEIIENSNNLNPGEINTNNCINGFGYTTLQSMIILPSSLENIYYLFHQAIGVEYEPEFFLATDKLFFTRVDMSLNDGLGKVTDKNIPLFEGYDLPGGELTAVKNDSANGWWIICPTSKTNSILKFKFENDSAYFYEKQDISSDTIIGYSGGQAKFSPDGTKFARYHSKDGIFLYDFDRKSGNFSNFRKFGHIADSIIVGGCEFSPSGRFLYVSTIFELYQFDCWSSDIESSETFVGEYDGFVNPFPLGFEQMELTPDGRIFMNPTSGSDVLHQIRYPDRKGIDCSFEQHSVWLPTHHLSSMPHFPNFRLGSMYEEPCDTSVGVEEVNEKELMLVYPNPASGYINIQVEENQLTNIQIKLIDLAGREISSFRNIEKGSTYMIPVYDLSPGMYLVQLVSEEGILQVEKVVVQ